MSWRNFNLINIPIVMQGIVTEPGETTTQVLLVIYPLGHYLLDLCFSSEISKYGMQAGGQIITIIHYGEDFLSPTNKHGVEMPVKHAALLLKLLCENSQKVAKCWWIDSINPPAKKLFLARLQNMRYCNRMAILKSECVCTIINQIQRNNGK